MSKTQALASFALLFLAACQTGAPSVVEVDPARRSALLDPIAALEGTWQGTLPDGSPAEVTFEVSSAGHAVREIMFPGTPHEMTNMYMLDGNELVLAHYCASGNLPILRATELDGHSLEFRTDDVLDLEAADEVYMGSLTLELIDEDHIVEHWSALRSGEVDHGTVLDLTRVHGG